MLYHFFTVDTWTVAFSPDSRYIATGSHAGKINLIGVESGKKESALDTRGKFTMSIAYVRYYRFFFDIMTCSMQSQICSPYMLASKTAQTVEQMSLSPLAAFQCVEETCNPDKNFRKAHSRKQKEILGVKGNQSKILVPVGV